MKEMYYILDQKRRLEVVFHGSRSQISKKLNSLDRNLLKTYRFSTIVQRGIVLEVDGMELVIVEDFQE